jgi:hypothetical protein
MKNISGSNRAAIGEHQTTLEHFYIAPEQPRHITVPASQNAVNRNTQDDDSTTQHHTNAGTSVTAPSRPRMS